MVTGISLAGRRLISNVKPENLENFYCRGEKWKITYLDSLILQHLHFVVICHMSNVIMALVLIAVVRTVMIIVMLRKKVLHC